MKKNISLLVLLYGLIWLNTGCTEEEPYVYDRYESAINFWIEPTIANPRPIYPKDLEEGYDFGSFTNFVRRGYAGFSNTHTKEIGVQTQGYAITENRKVFLVADSIQSGNGLNITLGDDYIVRSGESTAKFMYDMEAIPVGVSTTIVFTFDFDKTEFIPGVEERRYYTLKYSNSGGVPQTSDGFSLSANDLMFWRDWGMGPHLNAFGKFGFLKLKFISLIRKSPNLSALPTSGTAMTTLQTQLKTALEEYKALNATDPVKYPLLYDDNSETWISFP
jgi:hypothetical protein